MGSVNKGSFKLNKVSSCSKMNNSAYNKNVASKFGNTKAGFRDTFKIPANKFKASEETKSEES